MGNGKLPARPGSCIPLEGMVRAWSNFRRNRDFASPGDSFNRENEECSNAGTSMSARHPAKSLRYIQQADYLLSSGSQRNENYNILRFK